MEDEKWVLNTDKIGPKPTEIEINRILNLYANDKDVAKEDERAIIHYIMAEADKPVDIDYINNRLQQLITDTILTDLVNKGMIEVDFSEKELKYSITEKGKENLEEINDGLSS